MFNQGASTKDPAMHTVTVHGVESAWDARFKSKLVPGAPQAGFLTGVH